MKSGPVAYANTSRLRNTLTEALSELQRKSSCRLSAFVNTAQSCQECISDSIQLGRTIPDPGEELIIAGDFIEKGHEPGWQGDLQVLSLATHGSEL